MLELWEGHAADPEIRYRGSSGGLASALALYCIEREGMHGALHVAADPAAPCLNTTVMSRGRAGILAATGSRYSPASPCDGLSRIGSAPGPCVFIGKPCDIAALRKAGPLLSGLEEKTGLAIGIFCAGTPSTQGTLDLLKSRGVAPAEVRSVRYRGDGWPGMFTAEAEGAEGAGLPYAAAWGFLQKYRPYRCHLCPDGTSEFADLSCGDPWYRAIREGEEGRSLVLVRTGRGRTLLHAAAAAGYVSLEKASAERLIGSQENLLLKRSAVWGRLLALRAFGIPAPRLEGFSLFRNWRRLPLRDKLRSVVGTGRRIIERKYYRPMHGDAGEQSAALPQLKRAS